MFKDVLQTLAVTSDYLNFWSPTSGPLLTSDPPHINVIFLHTTATQWIFSLLATIPEST